MKTQGKTIFHVHFFESDKHHYFGSIAAIFDKLSAIDLGVGQNRLYGFDISEDKPYVNKWCIIRKSKLHRKPGNRKKNKNLTKKITVNTTYI